MSKTTTKPLSVLVPSSPGKSPKTKQSVRFQEPSPSQPIRSPIKRPPPTVKFEVPATRDYLKLLHQTKIVYDQLLGAKQAKLIEDLYNRKAALDSRINDIKDPKEKMEFGVKAQEELNRLQLQADLELTALHKDYQSKLSKMRDALEEKWLLEHGHEGLSNGVQYTVYTKK